MHSQPAFPEPLASPLPDGANQSLSVWLPEARLVILCARTGVTESVRRLIREAAQQPMDWTLVSALARYHGVGPLLYRTISAVCSDLVPKESLDALRHVTQAGTLLNRALAQELVHLCLAFRHNGVPVIPYKGATLAASAYGDLALRDFDDLDFIVPQHRLTDAQRVLWSQGYRPRECTGEQPDSASADEPYHVFVKKNSLIRVDLQWVMAHEQFAFRLDREEVWDRRVTLAIDGTSVPALAPEELLILLCVHGSKHAWEQLKWTVDVAELLRAHSLDWRRVLQTAVKWKCRRMVLLGLALARRMFDSSLPPHILSMLFQDPDVFRLACRMPKRLLASDQEGIDERDAVALYFSLKDTWLDRWLYGLSLLRDDHRILDCWPIWVRWQRVPAWLLRIARRLRTCPLVRIAVRKCRGRSAAIRANTSRYEQNRLAR